VLVDHDTQQNYGSWHACAGLGPGKVLHFNTLSQSTKFDFHGEFIRKWIPELAEVSKKQIHQPWFMSKEQQ